VSYLLDTNSWIDHLRRGPNSTVTNRIAAAPPATVYLCSIVVGELIDGAYRGGAAHEARNMALIASLRTQYVSLPFDDAAAEEYGKIRAHLASIGTVIGPNDLIISAIALAHGCIAVTHNTREFRRVPRLVVEDWQTT
jgi:tRNA(fMet)-specific endonuclease VapC